MLSFFSGYFNEYAQICYGIAGFEVVVLLYLAIRRPYREIYFNVIALINESVILLVVLINMFYRNIANMNNPDAWYAPFITAPSWVEIALLGTTLIANYVGLVIYIYKRCCSGKNQIQRNCVIVEID
jgi:hypothetical protein